MLNVNQDITALSLQDRARLYRQAREVRLAMQKETDSVESFEKRLKESLIAEVPVDEGFVVDNYAFVITSKAKPTIKDWDKVLAWIGETGRFDFLQKRLADKAVLDTENWEKIPGIERFNHKDLSVTKR